MSRQCIVITKATGGWGFHFNVTEDQAYGILNAAVGETIKLNEPRETIIINKDTALRCRPQKNNETSTEEIDLNDLRKKLREMIREREWANE